MNSQPNIRRQAKSGGLAVTASLIIVAGLLVLPAMALHRHSLDLRWVGAYAVIVSALTYWAYERDKRRAQGGEWRISESQLHLWELIGGWPGAWIAQRRLRHKCSKGSFQFVFWLIVLTHQFAAADSLHDWQLSRAALRWLKQTPEQRR